MTTSKITQITWSRTCQWLGIGTLKGTVHIYAINPFGGEADVRNHLSSQEIKGPKKSMPLSFEMNSVARTSRLNQPSNTNLNTRAERSFSLGSSPNDRVQPELNLKDIPIKPIPNFIFLEDFPSDENARLWGFGPPPLSISQSSTQDETNLQPRTVLDVLVFHPETSNIELNRLICSAKPEASDNLSNLNNPGSKDGSSVENSRTRSESFGKRFLPSSSEKSGEFFSSSKTTSSTGTTPSRISGLTQMMRRASEGINASTNMISSNWNTQSIGNSIPNPSLISPTRVANNLLNGSSHSSRILAECSRLATWGPLAREASSSTTREPCKSFSNISSSVNENERRILISRIKSREENRFKRVKISSANGNGWVSLAEMTSFSKIKGIHLPSIYLSRQFNFAIFKDQEESQQSILSSIHRAQSKKLKIREEVKISSKDSFNPSSSPSRDQSLAQIDENEFSTSFDLSLASAISANLDPGLSFENLSPSSRIPMFPQGKAAIGSGNWRSSVSSVTGGIPIRSVAEGLGGGLEKARRGVVSRRRSLSGKDRNRQKDRESGSTSLSFDGEDLNEGDEEFAEAMGKKDSGVSTSVSPDKLIKENRKDRDDDDRVLLDEEEDLLDEDYNLARKNQDEVESWDSLEDKVWGGKGAANNRILLKEDSMLTENQEKEKEHSPEEFTLGLFDEEVQPATKVSKSSKVEINLNKRPLVYQTQSTNNNNPSSTSSSFSSKSTSTTTTINNNNQNLNVGVGKSKSKSKSKSSSQDSSYSVSPALSVKSNKTGSSS